MLFSFTSIGKFFPGGYMYLSQGKDIRETDNGSLKEFFA